jgi:predicted NBD/HSP70 family sugar kinase
VRTPERVDARSAILRALAVSGALSRADLVRVTSLAFSTVSALVVELQDEGLVTTPGARPTAEEQPGRGRPPTLLVLHRSAGVVVGVDFGKQHVHAVAADFAHTVLAERRTETEPDLPAQAGVALAAELVDQVLAEADVARAEVLGVGVGLPGPIEGTAAEVGGSSILPGWIGVGASRLLERSFALPVLVDNDANLGALSEWMWGAGRGCANMVFIKAATGIGCGLIVNGEPYRGAQGIAGELGHTPIDRAGPVCRCGKRGCLETLAGTQAVLASLGASDGIDEVVGRCNAGDARVREAIGDAGEAVGSAVAILCNLFNPERVVVGGELGSAGEAFIGPLRHAVARDALGLVSTRLEITASALGDRAVALGAVGLVLRATTQFPARRPLRRLAGNA